MPILGLLAPDRLHIPDGFLSTAVSLVGWVLAIAAIAYALRQTREQLGDKQIPLMGVLAAFIFAAQALNFPVAGGTTGHLLGSALAAILMGPWAAVLIMASVVSIQGLVFQDGGVFALGFNLVNMAVLAPLVAHLVYQLVRRVLGAGRNSLLVGAVAAGWISIMVGAVAIAVQLATSGTSPLAVGLPAMAAVHAVLGVGEALITAGALAFLHATRRDLLNMGEVAPAKASANWVAGGLGLALVLALLSPLAASDPDGLGRVAIDLGFESQALAPLYQLLPDYNIPGVSNAAVSGILAMLIGTLVVFGAVYALGRAQRRKTNA